MYLHKTQTDNITADIEARIRSGEFKSGQKLPGVRKLAEQYSVSSQVIQSAVKVLMERGILATMPRVGVFVKPEAQIHGRKNMAILTHYLGNVENDYLSNLLGLGCSSLWAEFKQRRYTLPSFANSSHSKEVINYELQNIAKDAPDVLLVDLPRLEREALELFTDLPFPVVFIGDLHIAEQDGVANQITEDTADRARAYVDTVDKLGAGSLLLVGGGVHNYFCRVMYETSREQARNLGIDYRHYAHREYDSNDEEDVRQVHAEILQALTSGSSIADAIVFDGMPEVGMFCELAHECEALKNKMPHIITSGELVDSAVCMRADYGKFRVKAAELINGLIDGKTSCIGRQVLSGCVEYEAYRFTRI